MKEKIIRIIVVTTLGGLYKWYEKNQYGYSLQQIADPFKEETVCLDVNQEDIPDQVKKHLD
jgi:hypothetical protein